MFDYYLALGDSMSIDYYATQDAERCGLGEIDHIGAASLFYSNNSTLFPEFENNDLKAKYAGIKHLNVCIDGATCDDLQYQIGSKDIDEIKSNHRVLVTVTQGGNDMLHAFRRSMEGQDLLSLFGALRSNYKKSIEQIKKRLPNSLILLSTVFDPTDGTGVLPTDSPLYNKKMPIEYLGEFNNFVKGFAGGKVVIADVHKHFLGHGAGCGSQESFWYWPPSPIEPSLRGSGEIRRVWMNALLGSALVSK